MRHKACVREASRSRPEGENVSGLSVLTFSNSVQFRQAQRIVQIFRDFTAHYIVDIPYR